MIQENLETIRLSDYSNEKVRERLLDNQLNPILEGEDIFYASPLADGSMKVSRMKAIPFATLKSPSLTLRQFQVHQEYLGTLVELCPRMGDLATLIGVRTTKLHPIFRRYGVPLTKYRLRERNPIPLGLDLVEFQELYEQEAYTLRELADHYDLTLGEVRRILDDQGFVAPIDALKIQKRMERNPQYLTVGGLRLPPPTPVQLEKAMEEGHDTVAKLATLFEVDPRTMTRWLDQHGLQTAGMRARRSSSRVEGLHDIVYQEVIRKGRSVPEVAKELGQGRQTVWRAASSFPEWGLENRRMKTIPSALLGRLYHAVKDKRMKKFEACQMAGVSHKTLDREFSRYELERRGGS